MTRYLNEIGAVLILSLTDLHFAQRGEAGCCRQDHCGEEGGGGSIPFVRASVWSKKIRRVRSSIEPEDHMRQQARLGTAYQSHAYECKDHQAQIARGSPDRTCTCITCIFYLSVLLMSGFVQQLALSTKTASHCAPKGKQQPCPPAS